MSEQLTVEMLKDIVDVDRMMEMEMQGRERWPEHYQVWAVVDEYVYRKQVYQNVSMKLYREDMSEDEAITLMMAAGLSREDCDRDSQTIAWEIFTLAQVTALIPFIANYEGTHVCVELADKPRKNHCGFCRLPLGGGVDNYAYYREKDYPLAFKVSGIYDVRDY